MKVDLTSGYITEIVAQRSGDLQIKNIMQPLAQLPICAMWPPEAHEFDTPDMEHRSRKFLSNSDLLLKLNDHEEFQNSKINNSFYIKQSWYLLEVNVNVIF